jgi:predicted GNAT superfamily acetyltransferase
VALAADDSGFPVAGLPVVGRSGSRIFLVGVPADIEAMRLSDPGLAAAWRTALRDVLSPLMADGARVTGFDRSGWYVVSMEGKKDEANRG